MKNYVSILGLTVIGALSLPQSAEASLISLNPRHFPGTECMKKAGTMGITPHAEIYNAATASNLSVVCPVLKEIPTGGMSGTITYIDQSPNTLWCIAGCDDGTTFQSTTVASTENDAEIHTMSTGVSAPGSDVSFCHFRCTIPPKNSGKASYLIGYSGK